MQFSYRITKYNPKYRNEKGHYLRNDWISYYGIGKEYIDGKLTLEKYLETEKKYIDAIIKFMDCLNISTLQVNSLERHNGFLEELEQDKNNAQEMIEMFKTIKEGDVLNTAQVKDLCKLILRDYIWCRLENNSNMFVHFGYDYYMYIGSKNECKRAVNKIEKSGLFVEDFESPYLDDDEE